MADNQKHSDDNKDFIVGNNGKTYLTQQEKKCLIGIAKLKTMKEIANDLNISIQAVDSHLRRVKEKLGAYNRNQLYQIIKNNHLI